MKPTIIKTKKILPVSKKNEAREDLFKDMRRLHRKDEAGSCEAFGEDVVQGWCRARNYVLSQLKKEKSWGSDGIAASSSERVHIVIDCVDPMAFYIARHAALTLHFPNFNEGDGVSQAPSKSTMITLLYNRKKYPDIIAELRKEEFLGNLTNLCKYTLITVEKDDKENGQKWKNCVVKNPYSFVGIELELLGFNDDDFRYEANGKGGLGLFHIGRKVIEEEKNRKCDCKVNVTHARRVNMVYQVGADIDNLPLDDPNISDRYSRALLYFCYQQSKGKTLEKWNEIAEYTNEDDKKGTLYQIKLRNKLSNVFCADCFVTRLKSLFDNKVRKDMEKVIKKAYRSKKNEKIDWKKVIKKAYCFLNRSKEDEEIDWKKMIKKACRSVKRSKEDEEIDCETVCITTDMLNYMIKNYEKDLLKLVGNNLKTMAKCEHARWNVEKLILGFSPFSHQEQYEYNRRFGSSRSSYRNKLKKNEAHHINLCSYDDLRRIDPDNMKYDSFLMLAMVRILKEGITG